MHNKGRVSLNKDKERLEQLYRQRTVVTQLVNLFKNQEFANFFYNIVERGSTMEPYLAIFKEGQRDVLNKLENLKNSLNVIEQEIILLTNKNPQEEENLWNPQ